jgi:3-deoxy-D-manno-octulosonate 8-phosphate phosphatase (KDO 8-P phosphatase)
MDASTRESVLARASRVRLMIFDVDGILTDGSLQYSGDGEAVKRFNVLDGHGIKLLQQNGILTAFMSARNSPAVSRRAADLNIAYVIQGAHDKRAALKKLCDDAGVAASECGFAGDDWVDLPVLTRVEFAATVPNAHAEIRVRAHYITEAYGGQGAARELCDLLLRAQGKYDIALAPFLT